ESLFIKSFNLAKSNPSKTGLMVLFDALFFILVLYVFPAANQYIAQGIFITPTTLSFYLLIFLSLIYYLIIILVYSFFKYIVLDYIKSLFERTEFSFSRLGQFYALNIVIAGIFFAIMILANLLLASIKPQYRPFVFIALATPYLLLLYVIANVAHSAFYQGASIKESLKKGFKTTFTKIRIYRETILIMILFALLLWLLFLGLGYLIRLTANNYSLYLRLYSYFTEFSKWSVMVVAYFAILINRISFYALTREEK
ncbi:MAG: hypothetical protein Q8R04_06540, partial [Nanoarchaeota archaeon]|nr:hypothetical protein [Nanoarchaeota archaeon]